MISREGSPAPQLGLSLITLNCFIGYAKPKVAPEYTKVAIKMIRKTSLGYKYYNLNSNEIPTDRKRTINEETSEENLREFPRTRKNARTRTAPNLRVEVRYIFKFFSDHLMFLKLCRRQSGI